MIFRIHHQTAYTCVANDSIRDPDLSFKATGLLVFLLSMPDTWNPNRAHLASVKPDGDAAVRSALSELIDRGYVVRERITLDNGTFAWLHHVHERPEIAPPCTEKPLVDDPLVENHPLVSNEDEVPDEEVTNDASVEESTPDPFDEFWTVYPRKVAKPRARQAYASALKRTDHNTIAEGLAPFLAYWMTLTGAERDYIPHPSTWLNQDRWDDTPPAARRATAKRTGTDVARDYINRHGGTT